MPTRLYRFHCTDGHELVTDLDGSPLSNAAQSVFMPSAWPLP
ncbi:hypothetical protein [Methylobacterium sp. GC_Met_2]|nr:hypothetical protein [Methylobacterium sp. GC_Met_2]